MDFLSDLEIYLSTKFPYAPLVCIAVGVGNSLYEPALSTIPGRGHASSKMTGELLHLGPCQVLFREVWVCVGWPPGILCSSVGAVCQVLGPFAHPIPGGCQQDFQGVFAWQSPTHNAIEPQHLSHCFGLYHVAKMTSHLWFSFHVLPAKGHSVQLSKFSVPRHSRRAITQQVSC